MYCRIWIPVPILVCVIRKIFKPSFSSLYFFCDMCEARIPILYRVVYVYFDYVVKYIINVKLIINNYHTEGLCFYF